MSSTTHAPGFAYASSSLYDSVFGWDNNGTYYDNTTKNCQDFCNLNACTIEHLRTCVHGYIFPTPMEWLFICLHLVIFTVGVVGNFLVCFVVLRSRHMQSVTNLFIVNLAVADFFVLIFSSPPTVLQTVTETWFLGDAMCKIAHFVQKNGKAERKVT
ncbi:hypothetical protein ACOMHN_052759 [Nucella lapillus]